MLYLSRQTVTYSPQGQAPRLLCAYDSIMTRPVTLEPSTVIQRDEVYRGQWLRQAARGNASMQLTFSVATAHATRAEAEAYGDDLLHDLLLHPQGTLSLLSCYTGTVPGREREYLATLDKCDPQPVTAENQYGRDLSNKACWITIDYQFTLTHPATLTTAVADYTSSPVVEFRERDFYQYADYPEFSGRLLAGIFTVPYKIKTISRFSLQALSGISICSKDGTIITTSTEIVQDGIANGRPTYQYSFAPPIRLIKADESAYLHFPGEVNGRPYYVGRTMSVQQPFNFIFGTVATEVMGRTPMFGEITATLYT